MTCHMRRESQRLTLAAWLLAHSPRAVQREREVKARLVANKKKAEEEAKALAIKRQRVNRRKKIQ